MKAPAAPHVTRCEREVLVLLAGGQTAQDIARTLGLSPHTVRSERRSAYARLRVGSLIEAMNALGWVKVVD